MAVCAFLSMWGYPSVLWAATEESVADVKRAVKRAVHAREYDQSVLESIRALPRKERSPLARALAKSANPTMRLSAARILSQFRPSKVRDTIEKLAKDENRGVRHLALRYLAEKTGDSGARDALLKEAAGGDPKTAAAAIQELGRIGGKDVEALFKKLLLSDKTPQPVLLAAITAANHARAKGCTGPLVQLLDNRQKRNLYGGDDVRICDMAAAALQNIHRINYTDKRGVYFSGGIAERNRGIDIWNNWYAAQEGESLSAQRESYVYQLINHSLAALKEGDKEGQPQKIKARLKSAVGVAFCLGALPGVDAVVGPTAKDMARILRVHDKEEWYKLLNGWNSLQTAYDRRFLPRRKGSSAAPEQAADFIRFVKEETPNFPRVWLWSFCRNFRDAFPEAAAIDKVKAVQAKLEAGFKNVGKRVVIHGHIPVLEPIPPSRSETKTGAQAVGLTALYNELARRPSNWSLHRALVDYKARTGSGMSDYPLFEKQKARYAGSEVPYLANAAYKLRVKGDREAALDMADKSLLLNPKNAKAHAIRGTILLRSGQTKAAARDLERAFDLNQDSLGDEPETLQTVTFLIGHALEAGERESAAIYLRELGELSAYRSPRAVKDSKEYGDLSKRLNRK